MTKREQYDKAYSDMIQAMALCWDERQRGAEEKHFALWKRKEGIFKKMNTLCFTRGAIKESHFIPEEYLKGTYNEKHIVSKDEHDINIWRRTAKGGVFWLPIQVAHAHFNLTSQNYWQLDLACFQEGFKYDVSDDECWVLFIEEMWEKSRDAHSYLREYSSRTAKQLYHEEGIIAVSATMSF
jgi:hypothetical protein